MNTIERTLERRGSYKENKNIKKAYTYNHKERDEIHETYNQERGQIEFNF